MADARRAVRELLEELDLEPGSLLLVACSGGPDSMALAAASAFEIPKAGHRIGAVIIDHGLQPNSQVVAQEAAQRCSALGMDPVMVEQVKVTPTGEGLEAAARDARYTALEKARAEHSASFVLLGHNQDDQAETVLLGLARGSGLRSIRTRVSCGFESESLRGSWRRRWELGFRRRSPEPLTSLLRQMTSWPSRRGPFLLPPIAILVLLWKVLRACIRHLEERLSSYTCRASVERPFLGLRFWRLSS